MAQGIVFDVIRLTICIANELPENQSDELHRVLVSDEFMARLHQAVVSVIEAYPQLLGVGVTLAR